MLGSQGIQPVTLVFNNSKNCFLHLSSNFATHLCLHENQILELSWGVSAPVFLSWIRSRSSGPEDRVEISRQLGEKLGLRDGEQGYLRPCLQVQSVQQVSVEPLSPDDWEILELHSLALEQRILDQIRVVFSDGVFPVWVDQHTVIYIRIASLTPSVPFGRLEQFTELIVSPKLHPGSELLHKPQSEEPRQHQNVNITSSSTSNASQDPQNDHPESLNEGHWGGIADLKGLVRYLFTRGREPAKEKIAVPTIPAILKDCILRTCGSPPRSVSHLGSCHGDVHILPWNLQEQENWNPGQSALTYGRLSKILSPKELREKVKQAMEKKKIRDASHKEKDTEEHMEDVFEQAVWRQPSVVLLDDLDHVAGAATSPEHEHGPEAVLRQHISQSLKDLVDEIVLRSSLIALIVTAQTEHALHPTLTVVQGSHFFQSFCKIPTPDQAQRVEILKSLIVKKSFQVCQTTLDLDSVAKETEGFMARDLNLLLERAIHANTLHNSEDLSCKDFRQALQGFTPPSLWDAQLQAPSGAGMERIGGLHEARQLLMDIILLPAKYPLLFSSLPLRQCSGVLLYGAPGTGKTLLAGAVAKESGMNFISICQQRRLEEIH